MPLPLQSAIVRAAAASDAQAIADIYNHHVLNTIVTFEEKAVGALVIGERMRNVEAVGFKFDRWIDVGYWQRIL